MIGYLVLSVLKQCSGLILDTSNLMMRSLSRLQTLETKCPSTQCHTPETWIPHPHRCKNLETHTAVSRT